jgi:hypothetical protein
VLKGLGAFRSDKIRRFLGHIVFNESLNGLGIALNIVMNEAKNFRMAKINICFIQFKIHSKNSNNSPLNPTPTDDHFHVELPIGFGE